MERGFVLSIIRIKFRKGKNVRFISHLDMMKAFQRAVRRAGLEAEYSHGFNPQMQMVFGAPLSLGFASEAEYADFTFAQDYEPQYIIDELGKTVPPGLEVLEAGTRTVRKNIMADISFAEYELNVSSTKTAADIAGTIMEAKELPVEKSRKGRTRTVDVRPLVLSASGEGQVLKIMVSAGNSNNLNPKLLLEAVGKKLGIAIEGSGFIRTGQCVKREGRMVDPLSAEALETK